MLKQEINSGRNSRNIEEANETLGLPLWKRIFDLAVLIFLLPGALLIGLGVALLVKCGSPGPLLFRQWRVGYRGRKFICYKFRTMKFNADSAAHQGHTTRLIRAGGPMTKLDVDDDPRLIPLGAALRATGLDELPQLINVLRGEMSIVGPRPCMPYEYELYKPWQRQRFNAVPGLTGLWQVSGKNRTTFNQMIQLDIEYSRRKSPWLDLKTVFKTLPAIWTQCRDIAEGKKKNSNGQADPALQSKSVNISKAAHLHS